MQSSSNPNVFHLTVKGRPLVCKISWLTSLVATMEVCDLKNWGGPEEKMTTDQMH